ncbi:MAG: putative DNA-binding transcriptional regulator YafY [Bradymonadia bacterium]|jgi:predicted DNA-binding transcriptional regulator YafY
MSLFDKNPQRRRPIDDRLAERSPREDGSKPEQFVKSRTTVRIDKPEEIAALAIGALVLQKVDAFGQTRLLTRAIEAIVERATVELTSEEMMKLEVEAYSVLDWLVAGDDLELKDAEAIAHRDGDHIIYDPAAPPTELLKRAIEEEFDVKLDYFSRSRGEMNTRRVTPVALEAETYLRAYCHARADDRVFRLNRITRCVPVRGRAREVLRVQAVEEDAPAQPQAPKQISLLDD